jgi:hypothetical protein
MNAGTCWGKNTIDPRGRSVEKPRKSDFQFFLGKKPINCYIWGEVLCRAENRIVRKVDQDYIGGFEM